MTKYRFSGVEFHVKSQDYFGTLATVLSLNSQTGQPISQKTIDDLMFLQKNYKILKKPDIKK